MSKKTSLSPGLNFISILLVVFSYHSCTSPRGRSIKEWEKQKWKTIKVDKNDKPAWAISTRKIVGTNFLEYKIEGDIKATPKACISSFRQDIYNQASQINNKKYPTYEIVGESKDSLLTYVIHNEPFPLKNTEMSVRYIFHHAPEGTDEGVNWKETWDKGITPPPSKKLARVQSFRGSWQFSLGPNNYCKAVNSVQFDAKKMPHWLINKMVVKFLVNGLENIREMTTE